MTSKDKVNMSFGNDDGISKPVLKVDSKPDAQIQGDSMADIFNNIVNAKDDAHLNTTTLK